MTLSESDNIDPPGRARRTEPPEDDKMIEDELAIASFAAAAPRREHPQGGQVFCIRMANSASRRELASLLIRKMYGWRGYTCEASRFHEANRITLFAETGGVVVGTMSLCLDSAVMLPADENFRDRLDLLRAQGRRLCEPSRLAIDKGVSKRVFAALIHISYLYARRIHGFSDYVIEVNPRHVVFYQRMLGFSEMCAQRDCDRVGAPAVLLRLPLEHMGAQIGRWGGCMEQHGDERSFYPYFFPPCDEAGIVARLVAGLH